DAVVGPSECAFLNGDVVDDVDAVDLDMRVGEGRKPVAEELGAGRLSLAAHPSWRREDDIVCEHLGEPVDVMGIECIRPLLEDLARSHHPQEPPLWCGKSFLKSPASVWSFARG